MQRFHQLLFALSLIALSWYAMMAVHELGHVFGALLTGGSVTRVVLHPLAISRTDVSPNPSPGAVVWLGPIVGCFVPMVLVALVGRRSVVLRKITQFFAGFCLVANGTYIGFGSFNRIGDSGEMLRTGTPLWVMLAFGALTMAFGLYLWHGLGSLMQFINDPSLISNKLALSVFAAFVVLVIAGMMLSPR